MRQFKVGFSDKPLKEREKNVLFFDRKQFAFIINDEIDVPIKKSKSVIVTQNDLKEYALVNRRISNPYSTLRQFGDTVYSALGVFVVKVESLDKAAIILAGKSVFEEYEFIPLENIRFVTINSESTLDDLKDIDVKLDHLFNNIYMLTDGEMIDMLEALAGEPSTGICVTPFLNKPAEIIPEKDSSVPYLCINGKYIAFDRTYGRNATEITSLIAQTDVFPYDMPCRIFLEMVNFATKIKLLWFFSTINHYYFIFETAQGRDEIVLRMPKLFSNYGVKLEEVVTKTADSVVSEKKENKSVDTKKRYPIREFKTKFEKSYWLVTGMDFGRDPKDFLEDIRECSNYFNTEETVDKNMLILEFPENYNALFSFQSNLYENLKITKIKNRNVEAAIKRIQKQCIKA